MNRTIAAGMLLPAALFLSFAQDGVKLPLGLPPLAWPANNHTGNRVWGGIGAGTQSH